MPVFSLFTLGRHGNFTGIHIGTARFVVYCTSAKYRVVEYYRVCRIRDVILELIFSNSCSIFTLLNPCEKKSIINVWITLFSVANWSITQLCLNPWVR